MYDAEQIADYARERLLLQDAKLPDDYFYASLPLCAIDAVWSIGVKIEGVINVVRRYCDKTGATRFRKPDAFPQEQQTTSDLLARLDALDEGPTAGKERGRRAAEELFGNHQRTSPTNGYLKAEAVRQFTVALRDHRLEGLEDAQKIIANQTANESFEKAIRAIPGQGSGISLAYFWMLAGDENNIKPDRMVLRFLADALDRIESGITLAEAKVFLTDAAEILRNDHPQMTPRLLDHLIWRYQRSDPAERVLASLPTIEDRGFVAYEVRGGYPDYHPVVIPLLRNLDDVDPYAKLPEDPPGTDPKNLLQDRAEILRATKAQAVRYLAQLLRFERFGDGHIATEFDEGRILAALHRLRDLTTT